MPIKGRIKKIHILVTAECGRRTVRKPFSSAEQLPVSTALQSEKRINARLPTLMQMNITYGIVNVKLKDFVFNKRFMIKVL